MIVKKSPCKVNLLLNVLGRRADGFHALETVMQPVNLCDELSFERCRRGITLSCSEKSLPVDASNLVFQAAQKFFETSAISTGIEIHLEKRIPVAAGLGGGSGNAATTLLALNEIFGKPLRREKLAEIAAGLGSDVPFFLQSKPALAVGRGEQIQPLEDFPSLAGRAILLIHPGFGISTPWAYQSLAKFRDSLNGEIGRAQKLISLLRDNDWRAAGSSFYNSLEAPAFEKFPILQLFKNFLAANGGAALMSGSGSTTFAIFENQAAAESGVEKFKSKFGPNSWMTVVSLG